MQARATEQNSEVSPIDIIASLPALKQGVAFSLADNKFNYLSTVELAKWKGVAIEAGYAGRAKGTGDKAVAVLSYHVANLKDMGVTLPILDLVDFNVGAYFGFGRIGGNNEQDYGLSATVLNIKF